jgi:hypothetical protein
MNEEKDIRWKQRLTSADVMSYYNQNAETNIIVDGSPFGLGAILNQKQSDGNFKPVHNTQIVQYFHSHFRMIQLPVNAIRCQLRLNDLVNI